MILGSYPCCEEPLSIGMPDGGPFFAPEACPGCGAKVWHYLTRVNPKTYLEADFLAIWDVDPVTKNVTLKPGVEDPHAAERDAFAAAMGWEPESR